MDKKSLAQKKLWILDMDGTVYLGNQLFPETLPFLQRIRESGASYLFFTNNASRAKDTYVTRLNGMGIPAGPENILTSAETTIAFLKQHRPGKSVYVVGTPDLIRSFEDAGICVEEDAPIVVASFDTTLTYDKLEKACRYIREGAEFISTHPDFNCPVEGGFIPDSGAICALITASTGKLPRYFGKPYEDTLQIIEEFSGVAREDMVVVGDRLYTDIALGAKHGVASVLVLSGETTLEDLEGSDVQPSVIVQNVGELLI
ncbi:MAG: HAD-IIA family hydrolase [Firmicutes bacterium]|nr:HAD-IIA family hydrolase [Bacillota bacterium]